MMRKLPIGIQDFVTIRKDNYIYIDKTGYIYDLIHNGKPYFLSRPRRFGKSLLLSTMRAYWEGKKELFEGLAIERLSEGDPEAFMPHPVFYFDFNKKNFQRSTALEEVLEDHLMEWEKIYGGEYKDHPLEHRFQHLIELAYNQTGKRVVVLVDEYDKPLLETMADDALEEHNKSVFKGFFSTLKSYDHYLKFVFLTGVTKFSKVSIFSDLNHLQDISMNREYTSICGITEEEIRSCFKPEVEALAAEFDYSFEECMGELKKMYDGYHFRQNSPGVYNPFSLLNSFSNRDFEAYWFATGTPTFLIRKLQDTDFDVKKFTDGSIYADAATLSDYRGDNPDPVPLFYQSGYLTIKDYDRDFDSYQLGYPNNEVKYGFIKSLAPAYLHSEKSSGPLDIRSFGLDIKNARLDSLRDRFTALYAQIPYTTDDRPLEHNFQNVVYIIFTLLGQFVKTEVHNFKGRADVIVETADFIYIFEFKRDSSAADALTQIEEKGYALPYAADPRKLYKIGVNFDSASRELTEWVVE